jgi:hypothetical protein
LLRRSGSGVKINGTDEYKRKCTRIAAKNGIRVVNPELSGIMKEFECKVRPPVSVDSARKSVEAEIRKQETGHRNVWGSYNVHKKEFEYLLAKDREYPEFSGVKKWRAEHAAWESERDRLLELIRSGPESLGVKRALGGADMGEAHREAAVRHERLKEYAAEEALRLHPGAAAVIHEDDARREREERTRREAEEAKAREEKEHNRRFRASILEMAAKFGEEVPIITNAQDGRTYSGRVIGTTERNGHHYAAQVIGENRVILHDIEEGDLPQIALIVGKKVEIKCLDGRIGTIAEASERRERSRGWSR